MKFIFFLFLTPLVNDSVKADDLPTLGDTNDSIISKIERKHLGRSIVYGLKKTDKYLKDLVVEDYIKQIGYLLVSNSPVAGQAVEFFMVNDNSLNAFALPGGFIGVHTGLINKVRSESELASVLAHEIAHVSQKHIARMIAGQKRAGMASMAAVAIAILASRSGGDASMATLGAAQAGVIQSQLDYSREYEREADRVGLKILAKSSFDQHAVESFLKFMQKTTESSSSVVPSYMRTHPFFYERLSDIQNRLQNRPYQQVPDSIEFLLIQARLKSMSMLPEESVKRFKLDLSEKNYTNELATLYGLTFSLMRARDYDGAHKLVNSLFNLSKGHPIVTELVGLVAIKRGFIEEGLGHFQKALTDFPNKLSLIDAYAKSLIECGKAKMAVEFLDSVSFKFRTESRIFELQSKGNSMLGNKLLQHRAQAEAYFHRGELALAIQQLELARSTGGGNYFEKSSIDARMKEFIKIRNDWRGTGS
mgnify:CR=1 FL=1